VTKSRTKAARSRLDLTDLHDDLFRLESLFKDHLDPSFDLTFNPLGNLSFLFRQCEVEDANGKMFHD
jgi:hypothetical protein